MKCRTEPVPTPTLRLTWFSMSMASRLRSCSCTVSTGSEHTGGEERLTALQCYPDGNPGHSWSRPSCSRGNRREECVEGDNISQALLYGRGLTGFCCERMGRLEPHPRVIVLEWGAVGTSVTDTGARCQEEKCSE